MVKVNWLTFASFMLMTGGTAFAGGKDAAPAAMFGIQLAAFLVLLVVGSKIAWKPITEGLNAREDKIRESLDQAEKAQKELAQIQETSATLKAEAETEAKNIISSARETASKLAKDLEDKAKNEAQVTRDNALKDIENARTAALVSLKEQSADLAITLAGKLIGENLDSDKNRALTQDFIGKL